ncbi:PREDICTED: agamous-like MADS-box protein AGL62 [Populus euphratica]|uniref:Agamous-like MADS-box protein AGL62 n=1 Tax=Populus euphratica TaxID=75702 RepID=A0AAJ6VGI5_POPEU|nr:PREDICTED: agamous-like MADS-box protein AGL62 [Populus euphratica]
MQETEVNTTRRWGTGRKKVEMKKIESKSSLIVTFCKRRNGLFKKASEFSNLYDDANLAIIVLSPNQRPYSFGHPDVNTVVDQYLGDQESSERNNMDCGNINEEGEACWWERSVEDMDFKELEKFKASLETLKNNVAMKVQEKRRTRVSTRDFMGGFS